jgi:SAM-dependent methyltransferase
MREEPTWAPLTDPNEAVTFLDRQAVVYRDQRMAGFARMGLRPGEAVLDAGCGPGTDTFELEKLVGPSGRVVGVDSSEAMIAAAHDRANARDSQAEFILADICSLELPDETFDLARCVLLLLHLKEPAAALTEMVRLLRPGGRIVCIDVDHQMDALDATDTALAERILRNRFAQLQNPRMGRQLRGLFIASGLEEVQVEVITDVSTTWTQFSTLSGPGLFDSAAVRSDATVQELEALKADLKERDAQGRFFACEVRMRCSGIKP